MKHFIYKTINNINGKYYIGKCSAKGLRPKYLGSGTHIKRAILKYGKENFTRIILEFNETFEINCKRENEIIGDLFETK